MKKFLRKLMIVLGAIMVGLVALVLAFASQAQTPGCCICNLKQMDGAKATWALENHKATNDVPVDSDLFGETLYMRDKPVCPKGGVYTFGRVDEKTRCSLAALGHTI